MLDLFDQAVSSLVLFDNEGLLLVSSKSRACTVLKVPERYFTDEVPSSRVLKEAMKKKSYPDKKIIVHDESDSSEEGWGNGKKGPPVPRKVSGDRDSSTKQQESQSLSQSQPKKPVKKRFVDEDSDDDGGFNGDDDEEEDDNPLSSSKKQPSQDQPPKYQKAEPPKEPVFTLKDDLEEDDDETIIKKAPPKPQPKAQAKEQPKKKIVYEGDSDSSDGWGGKKSESD